MIGAEVIRWHGAKRQQHAGNHIKNISQTQLATFFLDNLFPGVSLWCHKGAPQAHNGDTLQPRKKKRQTTTREYYKAQVMAGYFQ